MIALLAAYLMLAGLDFGISTGSTPPSTEQLDDATVSTMSRRRYEN